MHVVTKRIALPECVHQLAKLLQLTNFHFLSTADVVSSRTFLLFISVVTASTYPTHPSGLILTPKVAIL